MSWFCTSVPKIMIARCLVAKLRLETNKLVISGQFLLFCPCHIQKLRDTMILHQRTKNYNNKFGCSYGSGKTGRSFGTNFCLFTTTKVSKDFFYKNKTKTSRDISTSQLCTKNYDQMTFGYRVMGLTNRQVILGQFLSFYPTGRLSK